MVKCLYKAFQTVHSFEIISRATFDFNISQQCTIVRILGYSKGLVHALSCGTLAL